MKTRTKTSEIFSSKLYQRSLKIKQLKNELQTLGFHEDIRMVTDVTNDTSDQPAIVAVDFTVTPEMKIILDRLKTEMITPSLTNEDLSLIFTRAPYEPICMSPFFLY